MRARIYLTSDGDKCGSPPVLWLMDHADATLPEHPQKLRWYYVATIDLSDTILAHERNDILAAFEDGRPFIGQRLPF